MMNFDAFISYSSKDKLAADAACAVLEGAGVRCWIAPRDIRPGGEYGAAIVDAIDQCRVMVLIFSASANDSTQIHREIERAASKGVPIVPVRIQEVEPTRSMAYFLGAIHWLDALTPPLEMHLQQLVETVKAILKVDAAARGKSFDDNPHRTSVPKSVKEVERFTPERATSGSLARADNPKNATRSNWVIPALGGGAFAVLLLGGVWLYLFPAPIPTGTQNPASLPPAQRQTEALVPEQIPFISDRDHALIRANYLPGPDHKALAINFGGARFITGQANEDVAKAAALDSCRKAIGTNFSDDTCQLYAVGNAVVFTGARPPLPAQPWVIRDPSIERPFASRDVPLTNEAARLKIESGYAVARKPKALAHSPTGSGSWFVGQSSQEEAMRRALEACGRGSGVPCLIISVDDVFVVPIPNRMKVVGYFRVEGNAAIAPEARGDVARRLGNATSGWKAVAVGASGRPGLMLRAATEQDAIEGAMAECGKQDHACRVMAIGPFTVQPKN